MSVVQGKKLLQIEDADPNIGKHAVHWVISAEMYAPQRRKQIGDWTLRMEDEQVCIYSTFVDDQEFAIVGFRGTVSEFDDILNDIALSTASLGTCGFGRVGSGITEISNYLESNRSVLIQLTGHSLGGAISRCVGAFFNVGVVTFNAAAPPTNPVKTRENEANYHIVFDMISAWQTPNCIRLEKGFAPMTGVLSLSPIIYWPTILATFAAAHTITAFSNEKPSIIVSAAVEDKKFQYLTPGVFTLNLQELAIRIAIRALLATFTHSLNGIPYIDENNNVPIMGKELAWDTNGRKLKRKEPFFIIQEQQESVTNFFDDGRIFAKKRHHHQRKTKKIKK